MPTLTPHQDPTATTPVPYPTRPVAGRKVDGSSVTFDWTPLPDVSHYRLQLAGSEAFAEPYLDETAERPATVDLSTVLPEGAETIYWRVRAAEADQWGEPAHFGASGRADRADESVVVQAEPVPVTPATHAAIDPSVAPFAWEGVPEASGYQLQVAPAPEFEAPVLDLTLDRTASVVLYDQLPDADRLHWRVRTLFPNGSVGPWSEAVPFSAAEDPRDEATPEGGEQEADPSESWAVAAGPARHARTGRTMAVVFMLVIVLGFLLSVGLILLAG
ncbi:MAG: DNA-binding protein [Salinibacter sp.]